jgi:hypothetical protein
MVSFGIVLIEKENLKGYNVTCIGCLTLKINVKEKQK